MIERFIGMCVVLCCVMPSAAFLQAQPSAAGKWKMTIEFADGKREAGLEIEISGRTVTGQFVATFAGGSVPIEGEIEDGKVVFSASTTGGPHPGMQIDFTASMHGDDTLGGKMSAPFGDFDFTAERLR